MKTVLKTSATVAALGIAGALLVRCAGHRAGRLTTIRDALRGGRLLQAYGEHGFSAGPDAGTAEAGVTSFMVFLNREM